MNLFNIIALLITLAAFFSFVNYRYIKWPKTIAIIAMSLLMSICLIVLERSGITSGITELVLEIDFNQTLLVGLLSFLLFAGALHVNIDDLLDNKMEIGIFATFGVIFSAFTIGTLFYYLFRIFDIHTAYIYCLLFGALISPTDPIAVLGTLKKAGAPKNLEVKIVGESLFNDGIGVVVFIALLELSSVNQAVTSTGITLMFIEEVFGGAFLGLLLGWIAFKALQLVDDYQVEILITLALVTGGYALALNLHTSGPITIVIAGLMIGNHGRRLAMSDITRQHLDTFWELIDEILNAVLFVLIGLEVMAISLSGQYLLMGFVAIPIVLLARFCSIGLPIIIINKFRTSSPDSVKILTWCGLRGGISVALALSLPEGTTKELFLTMTYIVVVFSLLVQGLSIKYVIK